MISRPHPLDHAALLIGGRAELAKRLDVTPAAIGNWKVRGVPIEHCPAIEEMTQGQVVRQELRPDDWERIWPELRPSGVTKLVRAIRASMTKPSSEVV